VVSWGDEEVVEEGGIEVGLVGFVRGMVKCWGFRSVLMGLEGLWGGLVGFGGVLGVFGGFWGVFGRFLGVLRVFGGF